MISDAMKRLGRTAVGLFVLVGTGYSGSAAADACPTGGVIDVDRAYYGSTMGANACGDEGQECTNVYFYEKSAYDTAVCSGGKWSDGSAAPVTPAAPATPVAGDACPTGGVLDASRAYVGSTLGANACVTDGVRCDTIYFYEDSKYSTAVCNSGTWVNADNAGTPTTPTTPTNPVSNACPTGGVIDADRAYIGQTLGDNACSDTGARCEQIYFYELSKFTDAVCDSGRWVSSDAVTPTPPVAVSCPEYVFANGEIYDDGNYLDNACAADGSVRCDNVYFYQLPAGGYGYRTAACVSGKWAPQSELANVDAFRLRPVVDEADLATLLRQGLIETYGIGLPQPAPPLPSSPGGGPIGPTGPGGGPTGPTGPVGAPPATGSTGSTGGTQAGEVSGTNVQVEGVDEEDRIKSDGDYLYVLRNGYSDLSPQPASTGFPVPGPGRAYRSSVRILDIDAATPTATDVKDFPINMRSNQRAKGLYLNNEGDRLVVTASGGNFFWSWWYNPFQWLNRTSTIASVDISNPDTPVQGTTIELDGEIISTRRIDNMIYVATRYHPSVPGLSRYEPAGPSAGPALSAINSTSVRQLLPTYQPWPSVTSRPLVEPRDCLMPTPTAPVKTADVITISAINMNTMEVTDSKCLVGSTETLYMSLESIYLATTRYEYEVYTDSRGRTRTRYAEPTVETDLHKFELDGTSISYRASGVVQGHLGWNVDRKPFRMGEKGSDLRVVTMTAELTENNSPVSVTVLRDNGSDRLAELSVLPNARRPQPIGKPGEELYGSRFVGDRLYLVTFRVIDPLYVVDLSNPNDTFVAGELEIEGYSDYLHPLPNGYLLGLGKDAIPAEPGDEFRGAWYQGVKLSLFDVRDPANPTEINSIKIGKRGTSSPALLNHRAFTYLPPAPGRPARVAIGMNVHERLRAGTTDTRPNTFYQWSYTALQLFEVDVDSVSPMVRDVGQMTVRAAAINPSTGNAANFSYNGDDRSVIADDAVFYVHGDDVYVGEWEFPEVYTGPF